MKTLEELYAFIDECKQKGDVSPTQMEIYRRVEDSIIMEDVAGRIANAVQPELQGIRRPVTFVVDYTPDGAVSVKVTNQYVGKANVEDTEPMTVEEEPTTTVAEQIEPEKEVVPAPEPKQKAKSIPYTVYINEEKIREKDGKETFFAALRRIGLRRILNDVEAHNIKHKIEGVKVGVVWHTLYKYTKGKNIGDSPQEEVDNLYVYKGLAHEKKVEDLLQLGRFYDDIDLYVVWDDGRTVTTADLDNKEDNAETDEVTLVPEENTKDFTSQLTENEKTDNSLRGRFRKFMCKTIQRGTANSYITVLENHVKQFIIDDVDSNASDSVFSFTTSEEVQLCIEILSEIDAFNNLNDYKHHSMTAALNQYKDFIESEEQQ